MRSIRTSYFRRIFLTFFVVSLTLVIIIGGIISITFYEIYSSNIEDQGQQAVENIQRAIESLKEDYSRVINQLETDQDVCDFMSGMSNSDSEKQLIKELYFVKNSYPVKAEISIIDMENDRCISTRAENVNKKISRHQNWGVFRKANTTDQIAMYAVAKDAVLHEADRIFLAKAFHSRKDTVGGYILVEISRSALQSVIAEYTSLYNTNVMIVNKSGSIIYHTKGAGFEGLGKIQDYGSRAELDENQDKTKVWESYSYSYHKKSELYVLAEIPSSAMQMISNALLKTLFPAICIIIFLGLLVSTAVAKSIAHPIQELKHSMSKVESGDLSARVEVTRTDEIGQLGEAFNLMTDKIEELMVNIDEEKHSLWIAETRSLNLQMNPHFLYNTLDLIKWNAKLGRMEEISNIVVNLGRLLRRVMNTKDDFVKVSYELGIVSSFIEIQKKHYGDELQLYVNIEEDIMEQTIPKLILQPIVENAIVHGFGQKSEDCIIKISGKEKENYIVFTVEDNGTGIEQGKLCDILCFKQDNTHHIGLNNVDRRAKLYGNEGCGISVESEKGVGTKVILVLCKQTEDVKK